MSVWKRNGVVADLHVHTALSPCADDSCTPPNIVSAAVERGLDVIAVTDHNSAKNVGAMVSRGTRSRLTVIPGMEVTTREEVHVLCLFDCVESAVALQDIVYGFLPWGRNRPDVFGHQMVMDENGGVLGECIKTLSGAANISLEEVSSIVHDMAGLIIAAHVDRPSFSVLSNLGFIPRDAGLDALEISSAITREEAERRFPEIGSFPVITGSDAHHPDMIGDAMTLFLLREIKLKELRLALHGDSGREYLII